MVLWLTEIFVQTFGPTRKIHHRNTQNFWLLGASVPGSQQGEPLARCAPRAGGWRRNWRRNWRRKSRLHTRCPHGAFGATPPALAQW